VRPGITAFGTRGGGAREWKLKDLSRWYGQRLYRVGVAAAMDIELWEVPKIRADFVMKGLQTTEGGNVLTLSILDPDPERAMQILDSSIDAFAEYVLTDSTSNALVLSERGLMIQIEDKRREMETIYEDAERLRLDLALTLRDSVEIDQHQRMAAKELEKLSTRQERMRADLATFELRFDRLERQAANVDSALIRARQALFDDRAGPALNPDFKPESQLTETEAYRGLLNTSIDLEERLQRLTTMQDSVRQLMAENELETERTKINQKLDFELKRREAGRELAGIRLHLRSSIDLQITQLQLQIDERMAQIAALSPIERVGPISVSPRPVRPRKSRAIGILTFAGLLAGLGVAFVWDYVWNHRREIFSNRPA
jgi:hypothetical protein